MNKNFVAAFILVALAFLVAFLILSYSQATGIVEVEGIQLKADNGKVSELLPSLASRPSFIISSQINEITQPVDHEMYNATNLFLQVLEGNSREWINLYRIYNEESTLIECVKGTRDMEDEQVLSKQECLQELEGNGRVVVFIEKPNSSPKSVIELSANKIVVKPKDSREIGKAAFLALRLMFKNSEEILRKSNLVLDALSSG